MAALVESAQDPEMIRTRSFLIVILLAAVSLAGCFGGASKNQNGTKPVYEGKVCEAQLYLKPVNDLELYPGTKVASWLFTDEQDGTPTLPGPTIRCREGDTARFTFYSTDGAPMPHTIHWHGIHLPVGTNGGVGGPVHADKFFTYEFKLTQSGTYFYHCHFDTAHHMDMGMYGAFIIDPKDPEQDPPYARDYTLMLDEWDKSHIHGNPTPGTLTGQMSGSGDPEQIVDGFYSQVRDYYSQNPNAHAAKQSAGLVENRTWYPAQLPPYFAEYDTYLINGKAFPSTEMLRIKQGETIRLRFINAGFEVHSMHLHGHHMLVTHKDGFKLPAPYYADTILIGPAERYDVYVTGNNPGPWMLHDHNALTEANDNIHPGGMMTMLCYEDGWTPLPDLSSNHCGAHEDLTAGAFLLKQTDVLKLRNKLGIK
jgi:manganese oxidase